MNETRVISEYVHGFALSSTPSGVINDARRCLVDAYAVMVFGTRTPSGKAMIAYCLENGREGDCVLFGSSEKRFNAPTAALANGTSAHSFELDDVHAESISHPGAVVIPAALAVGQAVGASGSDLLEAVIVGYEVMARVGSTIAANHIAQGFHPTGTFGVFGATAAAAKLLRLTVDQLEDGFGIAGSLASGLMQFSVRGSMVKRLHAGKAAEQGVMAALLAKGGFTGPREILEGTYGFCKVFAGGDDVSIQWPLLTENLGDTYAISRISFKPSPACNMLHAAIECIDRVGKTRALVETEIEQITVFGHENLVSGHNVYRPDSILAAQYSLPFTMGLAIVGDIRDPTVYLDEAILSNKRVLRVADKVRTAWDERIQNEYPRHLGARVAVQFVDGTVIEEAVPTPPGSYDSPFSWTDLVAKAKALAGPVVGNRVVDATVAQLASLEGAETLESLFCDTPTRVDMT